MSHILKSDVQTAETHSAKVSAGISNYTQVILPFVTGSNAPGCQQVNTVIEEISRGISDYGAAALEDSRQIKSLAVFFNEADHRMGSANRQTEARL